jgi:hypothetical protein
MNDTNVVDRWPTVDARKELAVTGVVAHAIALWVPRCYAHDKSKFFGIPGACTVMRTKKPVKTTLFIDASLYSSSEGTWMGQPGPNKWKKWMIQRLPEWGADGWDQWVSTLVYIVLIVPLNQDEMVIRVPWWKLSTDNGTGASRPPVVLYGKA